MAGLDEYYGYYWVVTEDNFNLTQAVVIDGSVISEISQLGLTRVYSDIHGRFEIWKKPGQTLSLVSGSPLYEVALYMVVKPTGKVYIDWHEYEVLEIVPTTSSYAKVLNGLTAKYHKGMF